jgi:DNA-directed RNA polymerase specialized sigma24 family protein
LERRETLNYPSRRRDRRADVEVEHAAEGFDPFNASEFSSDVYRFDLNEAIDTLPPLQKRIIVMLQQGFPIGPKDSSAITIARALDKDEKTIRTHRDKAYVTLHVALGGEN